MSRIDAPAVSIPFKHAARAQFVQQVGAVSKWLRLSMNNSAIQLLVVLCPARADVHEEFVEALMA